MKNKIAYIISNIANSPAFIWVAKELRDKGKEVFFILLNPGLTQIQSELEKEGFKVYRIPYLGKASLLPALFRTRKILKHESPEIVHTHLFEGSLVGLTAAKLAGIRKRIMTRHHSSFHHEYFPAAVKYDRFCNKLATDIIAISEVVKNILISKENVPSVKVKVIHHGFPPEFFSAIDKAKQESLRKKYGITNNPVVGVISRFTYWKGIQYIIPAFKKLLNEHPTALLVMANARGDYKNELLLLLQEIPERNYRLIEFEPEVTTLYSLFDLFVHVPVDANAEAFGQTYVEALSMGLPCVFTLSGVANDFIVNEQNALIVAYKDQESIFQAMNRILKEPTLAKQIAENGKNDAAKLFSLEKMIDKLDRLYSGW